MPISPRLYLTRWVDYANRKAMTKTPIQHATAWLSTLLFLLNATVLSHGLVECRDSSGLIRYEWGCSKDSSGHCETVCDSSRDNARCHEESVPCDDTPVKTLVGVTGRVKVDLANLTLVPLPAALPIATFDVQSSSVRCAPIRLTRGQPSSSMASLRSVILRL